MKSEKDKHENVYRLIFRIESYLIAIKADLDLISGYLEDTKCGCYTE